MHEKQNWTTHLTIYCTFQKHFTLSFLVLNLNLHNSQLWCPDFETQFSIQLWWAYLTVPVHLQGLMSSSSSLPLWQMRHINPQLSRKSVSLLSDEEMLGSLTLLLLGIVVIPALSIADTELYIRTATRLLLSPNSWSSSSVPFEQNEFNSCKLCDLALVLHCWLLWLFCLITGPCCVQKKQYSVEHVPFSTSNEWGGSHATIAAFSESFWESSKYFASGISESESAEGKRGSLAIPCFLLRKQ